MVKAWGTDDKLYGASEFLFFALLSVRFGLWFFSRALRAQIVGSEKQGVALIELGYYSGAALGLFGWTYLNYSLSSALLIDALIQTAAGVIDLLVIGKPSPDVQQHGPIELDEGKSLATKAAGDTAPGVGFDYTRYWKLTLAVVCLTVGFQAVWFSVARGGPMEVKSYIMPCFYLGVGLSALVCKGFKVKFDWSTLKDGSGNAILTSEFKQITLKPSFGFISAVAAFTMTIALLGLEWWHWSTPVLILTTLTAFIYQILVLSLLDRIGREEKTANLTEMIKQTYLIAAVATIISIGVLSCLMKSYLGCGILTVVCCLISFSAVRRNTEAQV